MLHFFILWILVLTSWSFFGVIPLATPLSTETAAWVTWEGGVLSSESWCDVVMKWMSEGGQSS